MFCVELGRNSHGFRHGEPGPAGVPLCWCASRRREAVTPPPSPASRLLSRGCTIPALPALTVRHSFCLRRQAIHVYPARSCRSSLNEHGSCLVFVFFFKEESNSFQSNSPLLKYHHSSEPWKVKALYPESIFKRRLG